MKFPLSACPFPPLELAEHEKASLKALTDDIVLETKTEYERMLTLGNGELDQERWKLLKAKENMGAYQDRCALAVSMQQTNSTGKPLECLEDPVSPPSAPSSVASSSSFRAPLQRVLWFGTINCDLDDIMLGTVNQNVDMWKIKSSYVEDNGLDFTLLADITRANAEKPFDGLLLKWTANDLGPLVAKSIMRPRDFVYVESTGFTQTSTGERLGYYVSHSVELPGVPELPEYKLVRGKLEAYHIFRQKSKGVVEVYARVMIDLQGDMPTSSATLFSADAMNSLPNAAFCATKRKLSWLLYTTDGSEAGKPSLDVCSVCTKDLSKSLLPFMNKSCRICASRICPRCRIPKKLSFLNRRTRGVSKKGLDVCTRCVHTAAHMNAMTVAQGELMLENPTAVYYEATAARSVSSTASSISN